MVLLGLRFNLLDPLPHRKSISPSQSPCLTLCRRFALAHLRPSFPPSQESSPRRLSDSSLTTNACRSACVFPPMLPHQVLTARIRRPVRAGELGSRLPSSRACSSGPSSSSTTSCTTRLGGSTGSARGSAKRSVFVRRFPLPSLDCAEVPSQT